MLFLVGAQKAGTGSLYRVLTQNSSIDVGSVKEPEALLVRSDPAAVDRWYRSIYEKSSAARYRLDASTSYMLSQTVRERILERYADASILALVRDPVARVYSGFLQMKKDPRRGEGRSFREIVQAMPVGLSSSDVCLAEDELLKRAERKGLIDPSYFDAGYLQRERGAPADVHYDPEDRLWAYRYFAHSMYSVHLPRWQGSFGKRYLAIGFSLLKDRPQAVSDRVSEFLGLPAVPVAEAAREPMNVTLVPRGETSALVVSVGRRIRRRLEAMESLRDPLRSAVNHLKPLLIGRLVARPTALDASDRAALAEICSSEYAWWESEGRGDVLGDW